jgi:hypothetical protein
MSVVTDGCARRKKSAFTSRAQRKKKKEGEHMANLFWEDRRTKNNTCFQCVFLNFPLFSIMSNQSSSAVFEFSVRATYVP